jgi:hypothetical protein
MKRPSNDAWFERQPCGPLVVMFKVDDRYDDEVVVEWYICPDSEDKADERAFAGSDRNIRGPKDQLDALIDRAMAEARGAAISIGTRILAWAQEDP